MKRKRKPYTKVRQYDFEPGLIQLDPKAGPLTQILNKMKNTPPISFSCFEDDLIPSLSIRWGSLVLDAGFNDGAGGGTRKGSKISRKRFCRVRDALFKILRKEGLRP